MPTIASSAAKSSAGFQAVVAGFLSQAGLPFAEVLSAERIERVFARFNNLFGMSRVFSTVTTLWAFLSQTLCDGKEASCQAAVAKIITFCNLQGLPAPTIDTGDYCRARAKLSEDALHELTVEIARDVEQQADPAWLWKERHAKLVDGFTFTMPDTKANQAEYPQQPKQKEGIGFPIARAVAILSLATGCMLDFAIGPYEGKETGETALLRSLLKRLEKGDVLVADRYYCSFLMIALLFGLGVDVCLRMHQRRHVDFRRGKALGKYDHRIEWTRPAKPDWMDDATYALIPEKLVMREIRFNVVQPGRRVKRVTIATTLLDPEQYTAEDIAELYGFRWNSELDIRSIKTALHLDHARCVSPAMVRKEVWVTLLAYNLIRTTATGAAALRAVPPRQISFTGTCQSVLSVWMILSSGITPPEAAATLALAQLDCISQLIVGDRPGRFEPRVLKRRRHRYPLMQQPRDTLKRKLQHHK